MKKRTVSILLSLVLAVSNLSFVPAVGHDMNVYKERESTYEEESARCRERLRIKASEENEPFLPAGDLLPLEEIRIDKADVPELSGNSRCYDTWSIPDEADSEGSDTYTFSSGYLYSTLNDNEKAFYDAMDSACRQVLNSTADYSSEMDIGEEKYRVVADVPLNGLTGKRAKEIQSAFKFSNPQYYFLANTYANHSDGIVLLFGNAQGHDFGLYSERKKVQEALEALIAEWMSEIDKAENELEKEIIINRLICTYLTYDTPALTDSDLGNFDQTIASCLLRQTTVCNGYALLTALFCNAAGFDCFVVSSQDHAWNLVKIYGNWYQLDNTWRDTNSSGAWENKSYNTFQSLDSTDYHVYQDFWSAFSLPDTIYDSVQMPDGMGQGASDEDFTVNEYGFLTAYTGNDENVVVPAIVGGTHIYGIAQYAFHYNDSVKRLEFSEGIEYLSGLFAGDCSGLKTVIIPSTMNMEGTNVLEGGVISGLGGFVEHCLEFENIIVSENNPWLKITDGVLYDKNILKLLAYPVQKKDTCFAVPETVICINDGAFSENTYIEEVVLPDTCQAIGYWAFSGCDSIRRLNIPKQCMSIGEFAFNFGDYYGRDGLFEGFYFPAEYKGPIYAKMFRGVPKIVIDEKNTMYSFENNCLIAKETEPADGEEYQALKLYFPDEKQTRLIIPDKVTLLGFNLFENASNLEEIIIGSNVKKCTVQTFYGMPKNIRRITIKDNPYIRVDDDYCVVAQDMAIVSVTDRDSIRKISTADDIKQIEDYAFGYCTELEEVNLSKGVQIISGFAFTDCNKLKSVILPDSLTYIGQFAFSGCTSLEEIVIPENVSFFQHGIFFRCSNLKEVKIESHKIEKLDMGLFGGCSSLETI